MWNYLKHLFDSFAFGKMSLVGIERIKGVRVGESWREREESSDKRFDLLLLHLFSISMEHNDCLLCKNVTEEIIKFLFSQQTHSIDMSILFWEVESFLVACVMKLQKTALCRLHSFSR